MLLRGTRMLCCEAAVDGCSASLGSWILLDPLEWVCFFLKIEIVVQLLLIMVKGRRESSLPRQLVAGQMVAGSRAEIIGLPQVVQWLRLCLIIQEVWVRSLVRKPGPHMPPGQKKR